MATSALLTDRDRDHLQQAIALARQAGSLGNLPIGCVICLDDQVVAEGQNWIWAPDLALHRHAEMEALRALPAHLMDRRPDLTLYTTLEPCLMCAGAILLHRIGRVVFGAADPFGGLGAAAERLPPFFAQQYALAHWIGPAQSEECEQLYEWAMQLIAERGE